MGTTHIKGTRPADEDEVNEEMQELIKKYKLEYPESESSDEDEDEDDSDLDEEEIQKLKMEREEKALKKEKARQRKRREFLEKHRKARVDEKNEKINQQEAALNRGKEVKQKKKRTNANEDGKSEREKMWDRIRAQGLKFPAGIDPLFYGSYLDLENKLLHFREGKFDSDNRFEIVYRKYSEPLNVLIYCRNFQPEHLDIRPNQDIQTPLARHLLWDRPHAGNWVLAMPSYRRKGYILKDAIQDVRDLREYVVDYVIWDKLNDFGLADKQDEIEDLLEEKRAAVEREDYFEAQDLKEKIEENMGQLAEIKSYYIKRKDRSRRARIYLIGEGMGAAIATLINENCRGEFQGILSLDSAMYLGPEPDQKERVQCSYLTTTPQIFLSNRATFNKGITQLYIKRVKEMIAKLEDEEELEEIRQFQAAVRKQEGEKEEEKKEDPNKVKSGDVIIPADWYIDNADFHYTPFDIQKAFLGLLKWAELGYQPDVFVPWPKGATVRLHSLKSRKHNGKTGRIRGYDATIQRYGVELDDGSMYKLKVSNLKRIITAEEKERDELRRKAEEKANKDKKERDDGIDKEAKRAKMEFDIEEPLSKLDALKREKNQRQASFWFKPTDEGDVSDIPLLYKEESGALGQVSHISVNGEVEISFFMEEFIKLGARYHSDIKITFNPKETGEQRKIWRLFYYKHFELWRQRKDTEAVEIWARMGNFPFAGFEWGEWIIVTGLTDGLERGSKRIIIKRHSHGSKMNSAAADLKVQEGDILWVHKFKHTDCLPIRCYDQKILPLHTQICGPGTEVKMPTLMPEIERLVKLCEPNPWVPKTWPDPNDPFRKEIVLDESSDDEIEETRDDPFVMQKFKFFEKKRQSDFEVLRPMTANTMKKYMKFSWDQVNIEDDIPDAKERQLLEDVTFNYLKKLRRAFMYYSASNIPVEYMTANQWLQFGLGCRIADRRDPSFSQIFVITNASEADGDKKDEDYDEDNPDNMFTFSEFLEGLVRVALHKHPELPPNDAYKKITKKILANADPHCFEDFPSILNTEPVWEVFQKYSKKVFKVFQHYAAGDQMAIDSLASLNIKEAFWFFRDTKILKKAGLSRRGLVTAFSMSQGMDRTDDTGYESNYPEFITMLGYLARDIHDDLSMEEALQEFMVEWIAPFQIPK